MDNDEGPTGWGSPDQNPDPDQGPARAQPGAGAAPPDAAPKPARAPRKKDPKLDLDLLEADGGFNDIWHKMAPTFKASFQGEGHEVADLRRLLELYQRWQMRFYPYCDFDTFVLKLEKAGRSKMVKSKMHSMRQNLLGLIFPTDLPEPLEEPPANATDHGATTAAGRPGGGAAAAARPGADPAGRLDDVEDDELVALQREADWEAAYAAMDDLETTTATPAPRAALAGGPGPAARADDADMDELWCMADEIDQRAEEEQQLQRQGTRPAEPAAQPYAEDLDEELIALAMEYDMPAAGAAGRGLGAEGREEEMAGGGRLPHEEDEDEELLRLAEMGTAEVAAAAGAGRDGSTADDGAAAAASAGGREMVDGERGTGDEAGSRNPAWADSTAEMDEELLALAVAGEGGTATLGVSRETGGGGGVAMSMGSAAAPGAAAGAMGGASQEEELLGVGRECLEGSEGLGAGGLLLDILMTQATQQTQEPA